MVERFAGKVALVTGGTGALGRIVASALHSEGAKLVITYVVEKELESISADLKKDSSRVLFIKTDVTDEQQVEAAFERAVEAFDTVDYLLNIAGGYMGKTLVAELELKDWNHMMDMNLKSAFLCSRSALKVMLKKGTGRIINISAMAGLNPSAGRGAYSISKAGVALLTQIIADEVKGTGLTANAIAPSIIATEANIRSSPGEDHSKWVEPSEIAELILYLCSESARSINGTVIKVYGGV